MEMTAVTNKAVLCSICRTRGEVEAGWGGLGGGGERGMETERKGGEEEGQRGELISINSDPKR